jgi:hypothetical protein
VLITLGHPQVGESFVEPPREGSKRAKVASEEVTVMEAVEIRKAEPMAKAAVPREKRIAWADRQPPD